MVTSFTQLFCFSFRYQLKSWFIRIDFWYLIILLGFVRFNFDIHGNTLSSWIRIVITIAEFQLWNVLITGDRHLFIWNSTKPGAPVVKVAAHNSEILTCDWSRYDRNLIATGGVDGRIKGWDLRNTSAPSFELAVSYQQCDPSWATKPD